MLERFVGHDRPQVGTANSDVNDVADALASVSFPLPAPDTIRKLSHFVEHGMDLGRYILSIYDDGSPFRCAQGHMQDRAVLRCVDLLPSKHGVNPRSQA